MSRFGERLPLAMRGDGDAVCPQTGDRYILSHGRLSVAER